jgi:4-amino-4-deoxychorismate lyase
MSAQGALRDGLGAADRLIETFRFEPDGGFVRLDRHLARLRHSATDLGFRYNDEGIEQALAGIPLDGGALRIRLTMDREGQSEFTAQPFTPLAPDAIWQVRIASTRLNSMDRLLRHKTTRRCSYEAARAEFSLEEAQEVLLLNEQDELCEGTITNLFVDRGNGVLVTPPLGCGLLPGILREELLRSGVAVEQVLHRGDLAGAALFVGNSLRGLIRAELA